MLLEDSALGASSVVLLKAHDLRLKFVLLMISVFECSIAQAQSLCRIQI